MKAMKPFYFAHPQYGKLRVVVIDGKIYYCLMDVKKHSSYLCPRNSEPIWSGFRGLLCIGTSTVVGAPNCLKRNL